ncbi:hypothetical protein G6F57_001613 [Rhizopus arrhizus]|uniref:Uncharacterized protein n=1 Tax=Rhizopus oryzae TaxID=64495 RepID=A0A9P6XKU0_RHIOR|nr:hypothetical protein G6F23_004010 [Rhizopus arrhizus]KAG1426083.1 hypothetical protein G6F58_001643 [Rhizopus delemar]KAG0769917.1 hypothetical protein G6F24_000665 [Rhizopus arrhizus]KAG0797450.1 hypothetical protein G6F21_000516 [Rhizopus arrhizus]KAG0799878.1 hypothetical protein G6F22_002788 [Rhizopus arrhizus]
MPFQNNEPIIQPYLDIISRSEPIDCQHHHNTEQQDNNSSFSTSTSSSTSSNSSCSSNYFDMNDMFSFDDNTTALSDILCDHYIQSKTQLNNDTADVPLETFRIFEAPSVENDHWILKQKEKEWTLVEQSEKYAAKQELAKEEEQENEMNHHHHVRDIRTNSDYFRIIVAEVNMMRAQKIVGPLRQRRLLPKRSDSFEYRSSPLRYQAV